MLPAYLAETKAALVIYPKMAPAKISFTILNINAVELFIVFILLISIEPTNI